MTAGKRSWLMQIKAQELYTKMHQLNVQPGTIRARMQHSLHHYLP
jgi:hypothetical protein